jgi:selenocysteine lyase/cysteine desulfurase
MILPISRLREETPGCVHVIHLNNAGSSLPPTAVIEAIESYRKEEMLYGGYETMGARHHDIIGFYQSAAQFVHAHRRNIAYTGSATESYNKALSSIPFEEGDVLLTTDDDYVSNQIAFLYLQKHRKIKIIRAPKLPEGGVDVQSVEELIRKFHPKLVAVTHVPTNSGLVQEVEPIGKLCQQHGIWYLVDACQSAGQIPLNVDAIGCDFLSVTMRKFMRGPRGAGFLYISDRVLSEGLEPVFPDLHGATWVNPDEYEISEKATRFEYFEKPYELMMGSRAAIDYAHNLGLEAIEQRVTHLANYTRQQLSTIPGVQVLDKGTKLCGIVTAQIDGHEALPFKKQLNARHINTSIPGRNNAVIDFAEKQVRWALRVSPHYYNTEEEIDALTGVIREII